MPACLPIRHELCGLDLCSSRPPGRASAVLAQKPGAARISKCMLRFRRRACQTINLGTNICLASSASLLRRPLHVRSSIPDIDRRTRQVSLEPLADLVIRHTNKAARSLPTTRNLRPVPRSFVTSPSKCANWPAACTVATARASRRLDGDGES
jgi:hypothetical protein